jgi:hypothetical protein
LYERRSSAGEGTATDSSQYRDRNAGAFGFSETATVCMPRRPSERRQVTELAAPTAGTTTEVPEGEPFVISAHATAE